MEIFKSKEAKKMYYGTKKILIKQFSNENRIKNLLCEIRRCVDEKNGDAFSTYAKISKNILVTNNPIYHNFNEKKCTEGIKSGDSVSMAVGVSYVIIMKYALELNIIQ